MEERQVRLNAEDVRICKVMLNAYGDENRQCIIDELLKCGDRGMRVNDIALGSNLSRPAVSRHLKVLKDAKIVKIRKEGTKNYYYYDPDQKNMTLLSTV